MENQILRNKLGIKIGEIKQEGDVLVVRDIHNVKQGEYDPKTNATRNARNVKVGIGNLLSLLL